MDTEQNNSEFTNKIQACLKNYSFKTKDADIDSAIAKIKGEALDKLHNKDISNTLLGLLDLTTLNSQDNSERIMAFVNKVNQFKSNYPKYNNVAAICTWPSLISSVKDILVDNTVKACSVSGGFPSAQTFIEVKVAETSLAIMDGADEIDIVLNVGDFLESSFDKVFDDVSELKSACSGSKLKVILETGALLSAKNIWNASILSMEAGADFIKTSTGKLSPAATPEAFYVMAMAIKAFHKKSGKKVGIKAAGGISTVEDALIYFAIVKDILGYDWLNKDLFRIGASRLANTILSELEGKTINYFA